MNQGNNLDIKANIPNLNSQPANINANLGPIMPGMDYQNPQINLPHSTNENALNIKAQMPNIEINGPNVNMPGVGFNVNILLIMF